MKPKREKGTCYGCGAMDHLVTQCPKRKDCTENNYVRLIRIYVKDKNKHSVIAKCLTDSGSPISFIRKSSVPLGVEEAHRGVYFGLNETRLNVFGKISVYIFKNTMKINFWLIVVSDESMRWEVVLGRDFTKASDLNVDPNALKMISVEKLENKLLRD